MKKINWWNVTAIFFSAWYFIAAVIRLIDNTSGIGVGGALSTVLFAIASFGFGSDEKIMIPIYWLPVLLGIFGIVGAIFQRTKDIVYRIFFAAVPCIGAILSLLYIVYPPIYNSVPLLGNYLDMIIAVVLLLWVAVIEALYIVRHKNKIP